MNILLTSVGRRAYIVKYFKQILGSEGTVHVCNSDMNSVAFKYADKAVVSPLIYDEAYISFLVDYCRKNDIDILIPLFDADLMMISENKTILKDIGTTPVVSDSEIIKICNDKWLTYNFLVNNDFHTPKTFLEIDKLIESINAGIIEFPIVVKPRYGCGSISVEIAFDEYDLIYLTKKVGRKISDSYLKYESAASENKIIYQEYLNGPEYGADIINNLEGDFRNVIVRRKIAMRSGETDIAELVYNPLIQESLSRLGNLTGHIANMDCDLFLIDDKPYILEMNARFGGGYPFSHMGGCNLPQAIINWVKGEEVHKEMLSSKFGIVGFKEIIITESSHCD